MEAGDQTADSSLRTRAQFATTHWSVVLAAGDAASPTSQGALEELCRTYWYPLYAYARRRGQSPDDAKDLVQGFFAYLISHDAFRHADPAKGRFRSYLLASFKHFWSAEQERARALKRGTGQPIFSLDETVAEERYRIEPRDDSTPDRLYERSWALTICLKCLEKDPHRRYGSVRELAEELGRFLRGEPTLARLLGLAGKAAKWGRTRPAQAALAGALVVALILGAAGVLWQWRQSEAERQRAEAERARAQAEQARVEAGERSAAQRAYDSDLNLGRARELVDRHRPVGKSEIRNPKPEMNLRGWEWRYLRKQTRGSKSERLMTSTNTIRGLALSPDGQWLAVREWRASAAESSADRITVWHLPDRRKVGEVRARGWPRALDISTSLHLIVSPEFELSSPDQAWPVWLWDLTTLEKIERLPHPEVVNCMAISPNGRLLATHARDGRLRLWDLTGPDSKPDPIIVPIRAYSFLRSYAFLPDSRSVLSLDVDGTAMVLNAITGELEERLTQLGTNHNAVAVSPDGRWLVLGGPGQSLSVWDRLQRFVVTNTTVQAGEIWALCFDTPGRLLRVTTVPAPDRATIRLLDTRDWREVDSWDMESWDKWELAWSPDDRLVAFGDRDGTVSWREATTGRQLELTEGHIAEARSLAFSPDNRWLVAASWSGGRLILWDATTRRIHQMGPRAHFQAALGVGFSPDGRRLVTSGLQAEEGVRLWDFETWSELVTLQAPGCVYHPTFSPDGSTLAAIVNFSVLCLWHAPSWEDIAAAERDEATEHAVR